MGFYGEIGGEIHIREDKVFKKVINKLEKNNWIFVFDLLYLGKYAAWRNDDIGPDKKGTYSYLLDTVLSQRKDMEKVTPFFGLSDNRIVFNGRSMNNVYKVVDNLIFKDRDIVSSIDIDKSFLYFVSVDGGDIQAGKMINKNDMAAFKYLSNKEIEAIIGFSIDEVDYENEDSDRYWYEVEDSLICYFEKEAKP